jgi:hypothetical protein
MISRIALATVALAAAVPAAAQVANVPTSSAPDAPICTDRPTKSNFACTVPKGKWQVETDLFNYGVTRVGGAETETYLFTNPTLKYGIGDSTDVEVNWIPYLRVSTEVGGARNTVDGVGDVIVRLKQRFTQTDQPLQVGVIPYVKVPAARAGIGNRAWEGGVIVPINYSLPGGFTLTTVPQLDLLEDFDGQGRHVQLIGLINLGKQFNRTTLYGELWTAQNFDPSGTVRQYSADVAIAHLITDELQVDIGGNFGLNSATPDAQLYVGLSVRW